MVAARLASLQSQKSIRVSNQDWLQRYLNINAPLKYFDLLLSHILCPLACRRRLLVTSNAVIVYMLIVTTERDQAATTLLMQNRVNSGAFTTVRICEA